MARSQFVCRVVVHTLHMIVLSDVVDVVIHLKSYLQMLGSKNKVPPPTTLRTSLLSSIFVYYKAIQFKMMIEISKLNIHDNGTQ